MGVAKVSSFPGEAAVLKNSILQLTGPAQRQRTQQRESFRLSILTICAHGLVSVMAGICGSEDVTSIHVADVREVAEALAVVAKVTLAKAFVCSVGCPKLYRELIRRWGYTNL